MAFIYFIYFFLRFIYYLFLERREGREKERERNINVWLPLTHSLLRTWPATQACALTGNPSGDPLVRRVALNPQSHTSQGTFIFRMFYILGLFLSLWCHFTCFSIPYISYILEVRIKGLIWFRLNFFAKNRSLGATVYFIRCYFVLLIVSPHTVRLSPVLVTLSFTTCFW